jgi:hypothetical protein
VSAATATRAAVVETTLLDLTGDTPAARFLHVIESIPPRTRFTVNDIRHRLDAADVPNAARGGLISAAKAAGLIELSTISAWGRHYPERVPSTGGSAKRATVCVYRRTGAAPEPDPTPGGAS